MIERKFIAQKIKEYQVEEYISENLKNVGHSKTKLQKTPLGDKIVIHASRPGLIVGRKGQSIKNLTSELKEKFNLDNPQIEIAEVENLNLNAKIIAERIANSLERFGSARFKGIGHKAMSDVMTAGAYGVEILISGKIPSARAKCWRFYMGYLKKCGDIALTGVDVAYANAQLKTGTVGIKVSIMPPTTKLPDDMEIHQEIEEVKNAEIINDIKEKTSKKAGKSIKEDEKAITETKEKDGDNKIKKPKKRKTRKSKVEKEVKGEDKDIVKEDIENGENKE